MRKLAVCVLLLWAAMAYGQQWTSVASVSLLQQSQPIPLTTIYTPSEPGSYRLSFYFSGGGGTPTTPPGFFDATLTATDITGVATAIDFGASCRQARFISSTPMVSLKAGVPLTYKVDTSGSIPNGCAYNIIITVEQLLP
jgi:hypothetical protein